MNVHFVIQKFSTDDLKQSYVVKLLKSKGVERLPALITKKKVYHGSDHIIDTYNQTILSFQRRGRPQKKPKQKRQPRNDEEAIQDWQRSELRMGDPREDEEDVVDNARNALEESFQNVMEKRNKLVEDINTYKRPSTLQRIAGGEEEEEEEVMLTRGPRGRGIANIMDDDNDDRPDGFEYEEDGSADDAILGKYLKNQETTF
jgi:hypothetical protein